MYASASFASVIMPISQLKSDGTWLTSVNSFRSVCGLQAKLAGLTFYRYLWRTP